MCHRTIRLVALIVCFSQPAQAQVLDEIWQAWKSHEKQCGSIRMEYSSRVIRTAEDFQTKEQFRASGQETTKVCFAPDVRMLSEVSLNVTANSHGAMGQGSSTELFNDEFGLLFYRKPKRALISERVTGAWRSTNSVKLFEVMCPTAVEPKTAYTLEPQSEIEGKPSRCAFGNERASVSVSV